MFLRFGKYLDSNFSIFHDLDLKGNPFEKDEGSLFQLF